MEIEQLAIFLFQCMVTFVLVAGMFFSVSGIVYLLLGSDDLSVRWCAIIVVGLWIASVGFHLLAVIGILCVWSVTLAIFCLAGIVHFSGYTITMLLLGMRRDGLHLKSFLLLDINPLQQCFLVILGIGVFLIAGRDYILPPISWDALTYHAVKAGMWVQSGHIGLMEAPGGWFNFRTYPGGGEALQAFSMIPFHSDFLISIVDFIEWLSLVPALFLLGRCVGLERKSSLIGGLFCLFLPVVVSSVGICNVDLLCALALMLAVGFASRFFSHYRIQYVCLCLMSLGVAGGVKHFAYAPISGVLVIVVFYIVLCRRTVQTLLIFFVAFMLMLLPMIPWLLYNTPSEGHSFFPISVEVAGIKLSASNPVIDWYLDRPEIIPYNFKKESAVIIRLFLWPWNTMYGWKPPNLGILSLFPLCVFPIAVASAIKRQFWVGLLIVAVVGSLVASFFSPSFSVIRQSYAEANSRFLFVAVFPAIVVSTLAFRSWFRERYMDFLLVVSVSNLVLVITLHWQPSFAFYVILAAALAGLTAWAIFFWVRHKFNLKSTLLGIIIIIICQTGLYIERHYIRCEATVKNCFIHSFTPNYWAAAATYVDNRAVRRRIAVTSGPKQTDENWFMYMFLGEALQNTLYYIPVTESGKFQHFGPWARITERLSYDSWLRRLRHHDITEVMSFSPTSVEICWMREHPESFLEISRGNDFGLFRVR